MAGASFSPYPTPAGQKRKAGPVKGPVGWAEGQYRRDGQALCRPQEGSTIEPLRDTLRRNDTAFSDQFSCALEEAGEPTGSPQAAKGGAPGLLPVK